MGAEPPFLYDHPSKYSFSGPTERGFNPKAISQASLSLPVPKPRPNGRLVNFKEINHHPDSYHAASYGNLDWKPMSVKTKSRVKYSRNVQLVLRICELIGAIGLLFCVICIKGIDATTGWIIRVPPGIAILHTIYGTYHYSRSVNGRTPSSLASYCIFAAAIDAGLIPLFLFTVLMTHSQYIEPVNASGHWSTLLGGDEATTGTVFATFITSVVTGTIQLISLALSIYLGVIFRKISRLPPDMNPLEANLTSRHKRKKSSILDDCLNSSSALKPQARKAEDPLNASPTVPFMHTRNDSYSNITRICNPSANARVSQRNLSAPHYDQKPAHHSSHTEIREQSYDLALSQCSSQTKIQTKAVDRSPCDESRSDLCIRRYLSTRDSVLQTEPAFPFHEQSLVYHSSRTGNHGHLDKKNKSSHCSSRTMFPVLSEGEAELNQPNQPTFIHSLNMSFSAYANNIHPANQSNESNIIRSPTKSSSLYSTKTMTTRATSRPASIRPRSTAPSTPDDNWISHHSPSPSPSSSPPRELKHLLDRPSYQRLSQTSPFEYAINDENIRPLEMNPPTPPPNKQKSGVELGVEQRMLTPGAGNFGQPKTWSPKILGMGRTKAWGGMGRSDPAGMGGAGRIVSRSGVEVKEKGIYPSGGIRAREVSGKVMEEGRMENGVWA